MKKSLPHEFMSDLSFRQDVYWCPCTTRRILPSLRSRAPSFGEPGRGTDLAKIR
ncbi:MAG: hypothetical protein IPM30_17070 [Burkholderiales bacterium]|jgi:hypothetical protein|nr:hypothetical protein [Burkholderiales bacterium]